MSANLVANVTISGNTLILAASSNVQYMNAASSNLFTFAAGVATVNKFPAVACGYFYTAVVMSDGTVRTFGRSDFGQLGVNDTTDRLTPVQVFGISSSATAVACGLYNTAVLLVDGTVRTFGNNTHGQLGLGDNVNRSTPVQVFGISSSATAVADGGYVTAVLLADGTVRTFGRNQYGQLGINITGGSRQTPVQVFGISSSATAVAGGRNHTVVLLADGTVRTFGRNDNGELGINVAGGSRQTPVQVFGISSSATAVACGSGGYHTAVLLADGTVRTFGRNHFGQLGVNDTTSRQTPVQVFGISSSATAVACGEYHTAVLLADGTVLTFGSNGVGRLGVGDTTNRSTPVQVFGISSSATAVAGGGNHTIVLLADGTLRTFGLNANGQLGLGDTTSRLTPVQVVSALSYGGSFKIAGGQLHTAVVINDGTVRTFGYNGNGQLGVNDTTPRSTPVQVWGISSSATAVAGGGVHTAVLLANGTVRTFGDNSSGQLGVNDTTYRATPVTVLNITSATAVACGRYHTAVLLADGTVGTFGLNTNGQLGVGDTTNRLTPVQVFGISSSATAVACGSYHMVILLADGTVRTFGNNQFGQLGVNDTVTRYTPVQVWGISSSATAIASGTQHTAVLLADGTVRTFGNNQSGRLGIGVNGGTRQTPVQVWGISSSAASVACGWYNTAVLLADGTVRTCGRNDFGQIGVNDVTTRQTPVQVFGISSSAAAVAGGGFHTFVFLEDGTVRTFGRNDFGQIGVNDTTSRLTPVQVLNIYTAGSLASTTFLTGAAQTGFTFNGPVFTTNLGLGRVPDLNYQLDLSSDGARKLQSSTWTTGSDRRIKSDIQTANLARCAEIVDSLDLKYFEWLSASHTDRHSLGWIAQDVQTFFPKSVSLTEAGTLALDSDQLVKVLWGALKHTLNEHFAPEVPVVPEVPSDVPEVPVVPEVTEPVPEVPEVPATSESLSVDPGTEASESLSEPVAEPVPEVPVTSETVAEVTEVPEVTEVTEPVPEVTEVPAVAEPVVEVTEVTEVPAVAEPVVEVTEVTEVPVVAEVTEVPATTESLSVDPGTEVSESLSEPVPEPVPEVPGTEAPESLSEPVPESVPE